MSGSNPNEYLRTKVMTASPAELRLMLLEGAIRALEQARIGILEKDYEQSYLGSKQCRAILTELISSVSPEVDPLLCERVCSVLTFIYNDFVTAMSERDADKVAALIPLLEYERETWGMAMDALSKGEPAEQGMRVPPESFTEPGHRQKLNLSG